MGEEDEKPTEAPKTEETEKPPEPKLAPAPDGAVEMKVSMKKGSGFYANSACSFLRGVEAKPAEEGKEAVEAKPAVDYLRISGLGDAVGVAVNAAARVETDGL